MGGQLQGSVDTLCALQLSFSSREQEIIELVKQDLSNKEIAAALYVSVSTVKSILSRIYEKTGVSSKVQLVMLDLQEGPYPKK